MKLGFQKWFSILGLLAAIIISLVIGLSFDLSILEGAESMAPGEEIGTDEEVPEEDVPEEDVTTEEVTEEETPEGEEITVDETMPDLSLSDSTPSMKKKQGTDVFDNFMNNGTTESFSLIQNF